MSDPFQHVGKGQHSPLMVDGRLINEVLDMLGWFRRTRANVTGAGEMLPDNKRSANLILVRNDTGSTLTAHTVVKIGTPIIAAATEPHDVFSHPVFPGTTPAANSDPFAILKEPLRASEYGWAVGQGYCVAYVTVGSTSHKYAAPSTTTAGLVSADSGPARILTTLSSTGLQLVEVLLQGGGPTATPRVKVDESQVNGDPATTYTIYAQDDPTTTTPAWQFQAANDYSGSQGGGYIAFYPQGTAGVAAYQMTFTSSGGSPSQVQQTFNIGGQSATITSTQSGSDIIHTWGAGQQLVATAVTSATGFGGASYTLVDTVTHADLTDADTEQDIIVYTLPAKVALLGYLIRTKTVGSGGSVVTLTTRFKINGSVPTGPSGDGLALNDLTAQSTSLDQLGDFNVWSWTATTNVEVRFTRDAGGTLADLTGGEWEVYLLLSPALA